MKRQQTIRRNPRRHCRNPASNGNTTLRNVHDTPSISSSEEEKQCGNEQNGLQTGETGDESESTPSEYRASDHKETRDDDVNSSDFEDEKVSSARLKRHAKARAKNSDRRKTKKTKRGAEDSQKLVANDNCRLTAKQMSLLDQIFAALDTNKNGRITISDILRASEDYGLDYEMEEARNMVRFWDSSGTVTISRATFTKLAIESKFMVPSSQ